VIALHQDARPRQPAHLLVEKQPGAKILPVIVIEITGDQQKRNILGDGEVDQIPERLPRAVARDILRDSPAPREAGKRAIEVNIGGVEEFHEKERRSFLKKRTKKLLYFWRVPVAVSATANKSFLLLFFKKEDLPS
jgi:hypothetical protein